MGKLSNSRAFNKKFDELEAAIFDSVGKETAQHNVTIQNIFTPGVYMRQMFVPAGNILTGMIHKTEHPFIMSLGVIQLFTEEEPNGVQVIAPYTGITTPGTRRCIYALEDTIWTEIHPNPDNCQDMDILQERFIKKHTNKLIPMNLKVAS